MSALPEQFARFIDNISLGERQVERIESATSALEEYLRQAFDLEDDDDAVFLQGSYANGTAIKPPEDGEYDVDVVVVSANAGDTANDALENLEGVLADHGRYKDRIERKTPCIRLKYADDEIGGFHVDVVPVRPSSEADVPLDTPRRDDGWHGTAPREFTQWCADLGPEFERTVKALKHWRSRQQDRVAIKSILLQVLVSEHMPTDVTDDAERLTLTLEGLSQALSGMDVVPEVWNPVLPSENLARRWAKADMDDFVSHLQNAAAAARKALDTDDEAESTELWQELLGDDFPQPEVKAFGIQLGDRSHARSPADKDWYEAYNPAYSIDVAATYQVGRRGRRHPYHEDGLIFTSHKLRFFATVRGPSSGEIWWRVTNTGGHARDEQGLRGEFNQARKLGGGLNPEQRENWEDASYTGSHLMEAFLVVGNAVVAKSAPIKVNIYSKKWRRWTP